MSSERPVVAFINVPTVFYDQILDIGAPPPFLCMPLGLMYLSSALKRFSKASEVFCIDYLVAADMLHEAAADAAQDLSAYKDGPDRFVVETALAAAGARVPDVIAVSLNMATMFPISLQIVEGLSRLWKDALVVYGGNYATNNVEYLLSHPVIDYVCRGEADLAFPEFINALSQTRWPSVKGFYSKKDIEDGKAVSDKCDHPEDLDELPFPDGNLIDVNAYQTAKAKRKTVFLTKKEAGNFSILTTRGCPCQCTFCASHTVHGRKVRCRSVKNVLAEMRQIYDRYGATVFVPEDDMFVVNKKRTLELLKGIKGLGIPDLEMQFFSGFSVNTLDEEIVDALCGAGMNIFRIAVESGSPYTQEHIIKKHVNLDLARRLVRYANSRNLYTRVNFIIGFPNEKRGHVQETINYIKTLDADWNAIFVATPILGSEMFEQFHAMGVFDFETRNWEKNFIQREFDAGDFTAEELVELAYQTNLEVNFIRNRQMRLGDWELALAVFNDVINLHSYHVIAHYQKLLCLERLGRHEEARSCLMHIHHIVTTLKSPAEMLRKYGDMVPDLIGRLRGEFNYPTDEDRRKERVAK
jgi:radical SAM superfamily enzyme YgiQ (UPF0313 family)